MKNLHNFSICIIMSIIGFYNTYSQQLHEFNNAANIDNEADTTTGWTQPGTALFTSDSSNPYLGNYALRLEATTSADNDRRIEYTFPAVIGEIYDISIWARAGAQTADPAFVAWTGVSGFSTRTISTSGTWAEYTFAVTATDTTVMMRAYTGSGSNGSPGDIIFIDAVSILRRDVQAPTAPTLSIAGQTQSTVYLVWSGATDDSGVTGYKVFKDGVLEATLGDVASYEVTGLTDGTTYSFTVTALDAVGNESVVSNAESVTTSSALWVESSGNIFYADGNVGIGTSTIPNDYLLAVSGKIIGEELKVQVQSLWPDYVFGKNYDLPSLEEVEEYIQQNGHLQNIPSAAEITANGGVELGEMNRLLLEKIEEMTLYIIQIHEKLSEQEKKNEYLEVKLERLQESMERLKN